MDYPTVLLPSTVVGHMNTLAHSRTHPEQCLLQYSRTLQNPLPSSQPPGHSPMSLAAFLYLIHYATTSGTWSCIVFQHRCGLPEQSPEHKVQCQAVILPLPTSETLLGQHILRGPSVARYNILHKESQWPVI